MALACLNEAARLSAIWATAIWASARSVPASWYIARARQRISLAGKPLTGESLSMSPSAPALFLRGVPPNTMTVWCLSHSAAENAAAPVCCQRAACGKTSQESSNPTTQTRSISRRSASPRARLKVATILIHNYPCRAVHALGRESAACFIRMPHVSLACGSPCVIHVLRK